MITKAQSLDNFIDKSLYEKNKGYYQRKVEFGRRGDFITSPGISKLFSEMIAIWVVSFWENLNKPEKINLVELGAGNGELIEVLINTLNKLEIVKDKFKFFIFEKYRLSAFKRTFNHVHIFLRSGDILDNISNVGSLATLFERFNMCVISPNEVWELVSIYLKSLPPKYHVKKSKAYHGGVSKRPFFWPSKG